MSDMVNIIGAGLAGTEACYQLAKRGIKVRLFEQKPLKFAPANKNSNMAELVCSNSLKSNDLTNACGLLKQELRLLDSLLISVADKTRVPSGEALSVDRDLFSEQITKIISEMPNVEIIRECVEKIDFDMPTIICTGPLTDEKIMEDLKQHLGEENLYFFDAVAPIVTKESLDEQKYFFKNRYDKGGTSGDYINCPLSKEEYDKFYESLIDAETVQLKDFENKRVFEGCVPIEVMAKRGYKTLTFGILKPKGLIDPSTGKMPYAVLQLRKESNFNSLYNLVGCQTNLLFSEQKKVFSLVPALKNAEYVRYGVMHRNSYLNAPNIINKFYQLKKFNNIFVAGQLSGVEGYVESISSGLYAAINMANKLHKLPPIEFSSSTVIGALPRYISSASEKNFQPMNANWGIVNGDLIDKQEKIKQSLIEIEKFVKGENNGTIFRDNNSCC